MKPQTRILCPTKALFYTALMLVFLSFTSNTKKRANKKRTVQKLTLSGTIRNAKKEKISKANILIINNKKQYKTSTKNGKYSIKIPIGYTKISIIHNEYKSKHYTFTFKNIANFKLDAVLSKTPKIAKNKTIDEKHLTDELEMDGIIHSSETKKTTISKVRKVKLSAVTLKHKRGRSFATLESGKALGEIKSRLTSVIDNSKHGTLTAGEINDFSKWKLWNDMSQDNLRSHSSIWQLKPAERYTVMIKNKNGNPIINGKIKLLSGEKTIWEARTDNTGKAELWGKFDTKKVNAVHELRIKTTILGKEYTISNPSLFSQGINRLEVDVPCVLSNSVDIAFVVDATGSMGDEINYLKKDLHHIISRIKKENNKITLNLGSVFYKDKTDDYITKVSDFSTDQNQTVNFVKMQNAGGGGDYPEAVESALDVAIGQLNWNDFARTKILFLWLDAPPHQDSVTKEKIKRLTQKAAEKGIRIVPLGCSGINKPTEYLMRTMALATNGTYSFLTNHSGIGNAHIEPTTDSYDVEKLNDLIVRIANQFILAPDCDSKFPQVVIETKDTTINVKPPTNDTIVDIKNPKTIIKVYPNPTHGKLTIDINGMVKVLYLADINGKLLQKIEVNNEQRKVALNLANYTSGIYYIKYPFGSTWKAKKIILVRD